MQAIQPMIGLRIAATTITALAATTTAATATTTAPATTTSLPAALLRGSLMDLALGRRDIESIGPWRLALRFLLALFVFGAWLRRLRA